MFEAFNQNKVPSADLIRSGKETPATIAERLKANPTGCVNCRCRKAANVAK